MISNHFREWDSKEFWKLNCKLSAQIRVFGRQLCPKAKNHVLKVFIPNLSWAQSVIIPNFYVESIDTREKFADFL